MRTLVKTQCGTPENNRFFFDDFFGKDFFDFTPKHLVKSMPAVNVKEDEKQFSIELAAPGLQKENFKVSLENNILTIAAEQKAEHSQTDEKTKFNRKEFSYSSFSRSFTLEEESIEAENIEAKYENGILHIVLPKKVKTETEKQAKTINII